MSLHRENQPALVATVRGSRRRASIGQIVRLQFTSPLAPQMAALGVRMQTMILRLRGVPVVPRPAAQPDRVPQPVNMLPATVGWTATNRSWMPS